MSCVLEILSDHELNVRKQYLLNQIKNIDKELSNRNISVEKDDTVYSYEINNNSTLIDVSNNIIQNCIQDDSNKLKKVKIKINIKKSDKSDK
jgi:hypothetical protein